MKKGKRGSIQDTLFLALFGLVCAILFISGWMMFSKVNDKLQATDMIADEGKTILANSESRMVTWLDSVFLVVFIGSWIGSLVLAMQINTHPIFAFISIILYIIIIIISAVLGNVFSIFAENAAIETYASSFTIITTIMNNYTVVMLFVGFTIGLAMWSGLKQEKSNPLGG